MIKQMYASVLSTITGVAGVDAAKKFDSLLRFHRYLNLSTPTTLADKVSYLELHEDNPLTVLCTDKCAVRKYITDKCAKRGDKLLIPMVGGPWSSVDEIDFDALPDQFVLKATHGCKMNYFVPDKKRLDISSCRREMNRWLKTTYGTYSMEPHYTRISHRIYAEAYLAEMSNLTDYKIHCLNGMPQFILTVTNRVADGDKAMKATLDLFDVQWNPIRELKPSGRETPGKGNLPRPANLEEMLEVARKLSADFKFVRVDLYNLENKILFGELTFSPACCVFPYFTDEFNRRMGRKLKL